jgi:hypothetical protein
MSNLTLKMTDNFILIPVIEVKLGEVSTFPRNTYQHDLIKKGNALYYQSKTDGRPDEMEGIEELQVLRYSLKEMGRTIGHLLGCKLLHPSSVCCAPNKYLCLQIQDGPRTFSKVRGTVKSYSGIAVQVDLLVDTCAYHTMLPWEMKDKLGLQAGRMEEAVMADWTVRRGQVFDVQLDFIDDAERQLTLQGPLLFLAVTHCILGQDIIGQFRGVIGQSELTLQCLDTKIMVHLVTTPGSNQLLMFSDNMQKGDRQGGCGRADRGPWREIIDPEEAEKRREIEIASHQLRLQQNFPNKSMEELVAVMKHQFPPEVKVVGEYQTDSEDRVRGGDWVYDWEEGQGGAEGWRS